jgi:hypothetical protein
MIVKIVDPTNAKEFLEEYDSPILPQMGDALKLKDGRRAVVSNVVVGIVSGSATIIRVNVRDEAVKVTL